MGRSWSIRSRRRRRGLSHSFRLHVLHACAHLYESASVLSLLQTSHHIGTALPLSSYLPSRDLIVYILHLYSMPAQHLHVYRRSASFYIFFLGVSSSHSHSISFLPYSFHVSLNAYLVSSSTFVSCFVRVTRGVSTSIYLHLYIIYLSAARAGGTGKTIYPKTSPRSRGYSESFNSP